MMYVLEQIQMTLFSGGVSILLLILLFYSFAGLVQRFAPRITRIILGLNRFSAQHRQWRAERLETLRGLFISTIIFVAYTLATLAMLSLFVDTATLVWMVGLFSAAFGLGARPLISDYLTGISFIFEDTIDVGEKIEFVMSNGPIEGVIEEVNLRTTLIRAPAGESLTVPNGEIRLIRNYSRGRYSTIKVKLKLAGNSLEKALPVLEDLGRDAMTVLPNLLEPWEILGTNDDEVDRRGAAVTLVAKAKFGQGAKMRPRLLALVGKRLTEYEIELLD